VDKSGIKTSFGYLRLSMEAGSGEGRACMLRVLARSTEAKSDAAYGVDERIGLLSVDLSANAPNVGIDNVS
jgi:hypothetical protein